jgi:hypothetical protein
MKHNINYCSEYVQPTKAEFGNLSALVTPELINICRKAKYVVIYGYTKSGKVIIGKLIADKLNRQLIISDHYRHLGWENNMYHIRSIIEATNQPLVIEGVQSGRLLRKGCQRNDFFADVVIHLTINNASVAESYIRDGEGEKLKYIHNFNKNILDKIFFDWYKLQLEKHPRRVPIMVHIDTSFK